MTRTNEEFETTESEFGDRLIIDDPWSNAEPASEKAQDAFQKFVDGLTEEKCLDMLGEDKKCGSREELKAMIDDIGVDTAVKLNNLACVEGVSSVTMVKDGVSITIEEG